MNKPSGKGQIVDWDSGYCFKCKKQFKGKIGLWSHVTKSPFHNKQKQAEIQRKQLEPEQVSLQKALDTGQKTMDEFFL
jgi:hypothetical protein